jgi:hypothetical protein
VVVAVELMVQCQGVTVDQAAVQVMAQAMVMVGQELLVKVMMVVIVARLTVELLIPLREAAARVLRVQMEMMVEVMEVMVLPTLSQEVL